MTKRIITEFEEQVIRLTHHNFVGLTQIEAAICLDVSQKKISETLSAVEVKCPQLFPILTKQQAYIRDCITDDGLSHKQIAVLLEISKDTVDSIVSTMKAKGICFNRPRKMLRYENWMDKHTKRKF